jgi:tetratricopeptide (TPR) repeat protein
MVRISQAPAWYDRMKHPIQVAVAAFLFLVVPELLPKAALAQRPTPTPLSAGRENGPSTPVQPDGVTLLVSVREPNGTPLDIGALVTLNSFAGEMHVTSATRDGGTASFPDVRAGDYNVEVSAPGYQSTTQQVEVIASGGINYMVYVYVQPESASPTPNAPGSPTVMAPRLQAEIQKALEKIRKEQYDAAREHLEKATKMAQGNADVQYLFGLLEYKQNHIEAARTKFQAAIALNPNHEKAYVALGELQLRAGDADEASKTLEKAYQQNGADWRMHLLLAQAYAAQQLYEKAELHAARAVELAKSNRAPAQLLLGRIQAAQGRVMDAADTFQALIRALPNESAAQEAKTELAKLEKPTPWLDMPAPMPAGPSAMPTEIAPASTPQQAAVLPAIPMIVRAWAPPDIDAKEYPVAPDVACSLGDVLHRAAMRSVKQLANFERFMATEHIVHQEVDADGGQSSPLSKDFAYLVFVQRGKDGTLFLDEERDGGQNLNQFPTHLASTGLVSLGVAVFLNTFQKDLTYSCEGLGKWRGQPAWQVRFEQRKEVESRLRSWRNEHGTFRVPLKGRVWVSANNYDVVHLETDLREPQPNIGVQRDHLIVDYGPVQFEHAGVSLWLPWYAEMFMEVHGKRYHHRHTLTNYALFSVDTSDKISAPAAAASRN